MSHSWRDSCRVVEMALVLLAGLKLLESIPHEDQCGVEMALVLLTGLKLDHQRSGIASDNVEMALVLLAGLKQAKAVESVYKAASTAFLLLSKIVALN